MTTYLLNGKVYYNKWSSIIIILLVRSSIGLRSVLGRSSFGLRSVFVRSSFGLRSVFDRFSFGLRSVFVRSSFGSRSSSVHPSFILRSPFDCSSFANRRSIEQISKYQRIINGTSTDVQRYRSEYVTATHAFLYAIIHYTYKNGTICFFIN